MSESVQMAKERVQAMNEAKRVFQACGQESCLYMDRWWDAAAKLEDPEIRTQAQQALDQLGAQNPPEHLELDTHPFCVDAGLVKTGGGETVAHPGAYSSFTGSPLSQGKFQFDLWDDKGGDPMYDWEALRKEVVAHGARNSLLMAPMPTASTAQIMGNTECFEIPTSNIYNRRTLAGEFVVVNQFLLRDLMDAGLWTSDLKDEIIYHGGSVLPVQSIPSSIRKLYKTVWDTSQKVVIDMAADRGRYICQSQSMNLFLSSPSIDQISSMLVYAWRKGLKTGMYYLRTQPASKAQQFTLDPTKFHQKAKTTERRATAAAATGTSHLPTQGGDDGCLACSA